MKKYIVLLCSIFSLLDIPAISFGSNGYFIHGTGAVNESLGGAAAAGNSTDLVGSINRNPANATLFDNNMYSISLEVIFPDASVQSDVSFLSGSSDSNVDVIPIANVGVVFRNDDRKVYYLGLITESGLQLEMSESTTNPIFVAQQGKDNNPFGNLFGGFGAVKTQMELVRIPIGISYDYDKNLSFGFSLAPSIARLRFKPIAFVAPDDANNDTIPTYPDDVDHDISFGFGMQAGVRYKASDHANVGFSITSPTWFERFKWTTKDEVGNDRNVSFRIDRPLSVQIGLNYLFPSQTLVLADLSWINYANTKGFDETGFNADGSLKGLGFDDIFVLALGVQHPINDQLIIRGGYNYCQNPIGDDVTFFNVGSPLHS